MASSTMVSTGRVRLSALDALVLLRNAVDDEVVEYDPRTFITTAKGSKISRYTVLIGHSQIVLQRNVVLHPEVIIRADLAKVTIGRYVHVARGALLRPSYSMRRVNARGEPTVKKLRFSDFTVGDFTTIGEQALVEARTVGEGVYIGKKAIIGRGSVLKDFCWICDGAVLPPLSMVPNFAIMAGCPAVVVGELPEATSEFAVERCKRLYEAFRSKASAP